MKYSKRKDKYCSDVLNDNFREIDRRLIELEQGGGFSSIITEDSLMTTGVVTTSTTETVELDFGFKPKFIVLEFNYGGGARTPMRIFVDCSTMVWARGYQPESGDFTFLKKGNYFPSDGTPFMLTPTGIIFKVRGVNYAQQTRYYAFG